jgi:hypothetical protein
MSLRRATDDSGSPLPSSPVARPGSGPPAAPRSPPSGGDSPKPPPASPSVPRPPRDGKGSFIPWLSRPPRGRQGSPRKDHQVISNGFGFLGRAPRSRRARPVPGASSPSGPAARAPGLGAPEAGARPRSSRPRPRAAGASRVRTAGTGGVPGRRRRPPSPWLPRGPLARAPRQGRTALDPPPGRRPTATSRAVPPPTQAPCAESAAW